jgi:hypothetical protein
MPSLLDSNLTAVFAKDVANLALTKLPVVTISATFREDLKEFYGLPASNTTPDLVFSRAHFSMAVGLAITAWGDNLDPHKCWVIDPTNYVSAKQWRKVVLTHEIGKTIARYPLLKLLKDFVDKFGRSKLPLLTSITPPLLHLTQQVRRPIISFHIAAGNILMDQGRPTIQVITDPHVREEYVSNADKPNTRFCVFDQPTQTEFLEKAAIAGKKVDPSHVVVTGPPIDPRVSAARDRKNPWRSGPLQLCLTTGGLGTNKDEIEKILEQLLPELKHKKIKLLVYAGTQADIATEVKKLAKAHRCKISPLEEKSASLRMIYHPQLLDANEMLIKYGFPWADGFLSKPSGDMAYDAAAAGCFLLTLREWGEWEHNVRNVFEQLQISRPAEVEHIVTQLQTLSSAQGRAQSWIEHAMLAAHGLPKSFHQGTANIIKVAESLNKELENS